VKIWSEGKEKGSEGSEHKCGYSNSGMGAIAWAEMSSTQQSKKNTKKRMSYEGGGVHRRVGTLKSDALHAASAYFVNEDCKEGRLPRIIGKVAAVVTENRGIPPHMHAQRHSGAAGGPLLNTTKAR